jgi:sugar phosphate isomerase/epimerase
MKLFSAAIVTATIFASSLAFADDPKAKRDDEASEKLGIKLSLQCWTFNRLTFFETVDKAVGLGVKYLEMYPGQKLKPDSKEVVNRKMSDEVIAEVKKKLGDAGVKLVAYGVDGIPTDEKGARETFDWAKKMGIEVLVTETTPNDVLDKLSQEYKIKVALHNHPKTWPPDMVLNACKDKGKWIGSCSDTGHWMRANLVPVDQFKKLEGRVLHSHFKDLNEFGNGHDVVWGEGRGDPKAMLTELKRQNYKGYLSIEFEYGDLKHLDANLPKCVEFFDKTLAELGAPGLASKDESKKVLEQLLSELASVGDNLESVKDKDSAKVAAEKIKTSTAKIKELGAKRTSPANIQTLTKEFEPKFVASGKKIAEQLARLGSEKYAADAVGETQAMLRALQNFDKKSD